MSDGNCFSFETAISPGIHQQWLFGDLKRVLDAGPACVLVVDGAACSPNHEESAPRALQNIGGGKLAMDAPITWSFEACGAIGAFADVSSWKMRERKLNARIAEAERANLAKSRILTEVSHDLRQPVQSLISLIAVIRRQLVDRPDLAKAVTMTEDCVKSLNGMLAAILESSHLDSGIIQPVIASVDLGGIVSRLAREYLPLAAKEGLALRCPPRALLARTDAALLERILRNLIENALRYTSVGGVLIGLRQRGDGVRLDVIDTGIGIPDDKQAEIFEEFRQLNNPARDSSQGMGLGLAIVSRLARILGAEVQVSSQVGRGTRFSLLLPREQIAPTAIVDLERKNPSKPTHLSAQFYGR